MPLDPQVADYLARVAAAVPPLASPTPEARRTRMELVVRRFPAPEDAVARGDAWIALPGREIAVRLYRPRSGKLPAILYLHGGGWVAGSLATHDGPCAALAADADALVEAQQMRRRVLPDAVPGVAIDRIEHRARRSLAVRSADGDDRAADVDRHHRRDACDAVEPHLDRFRVQRLEIREPAGEGFRICQGCVRQRLAQRVRQRYVGAG